MAEMTNMTEMAANEHVGRLDQQVALITGASSGIGLAIARAFLAEGAHLVVVARRQEVLQALAAEAAALGRSCAVVAGDVRNEETAEQAVQVATAQFGRLDLLINNAGVVMLVAEAIASLNPIMGVRWEAARNLIRADHFSKQAAEFRTRAIVPVTLWIRLLSAYQPPAAAGVIGTFGLHSFGSPNVEIHARRLDFNETLAVALAFAQVGLESGGPTSDEAVTTIENLATFSIEQLANGLFDIGPVAKLTELESADAHEGWRAAAVPSVQPFRTAEDRVSAEDVPYNTLVLQVVGGIRNAFYKKPKDTWGAARLETTRQLDGFFAKMEARRAK